MTTRTFKLEVEINSSLTPAQKDGVIRSLDRLFKSYLPEVKVDESGDKVTVTVPEVDKFTRLKFEDAKNKLVWNQDVDLVKEGATAYQPPCPNCGSFNTTHPTSTSFKCGDCDYSWKNHGFEDVDDFGFGLEAPDDKLNLDPKTGAADPENLSGKAWDSHMLNHGHDLSSEYMKAYPKSQVPFADYARSVHATEHPECDFDTKARDPRFAAYGDESDYDNGGGFGLEDDQEENPSCPNCGGPSGYLGQLGHTNHFRCQNCGSDFSEGPHDPANGYQSEFKNQSSRHFAGDDEERLCQECGGKLDHEGNHIGRPSQEEFDSIPRPEDWKSSATRVYANPVDDDFSGSSTDVSCPFCGSDDCMEDDFDGLSCADCGESFDREDVPESGVDSLGNMQDHTFAYRNFLVPEEEQEERYASLFLE